MHMLIAAGMAATLVSAGTEGGAGGDALRLGEIVREVRAADYRGERAELRRLASSLDAVQGPALAAPAAYWKGFALWRRAINGFNETPTPPDLRADLEGAVASFRAALRYAPNTANTHYNLGNIHVMQRKLDEAAGEFRAAIRLDPKHAPAHCNLGNVLADLGRRDEAVTELREALRLKPELQQAQARLRQLGE